MKDRNASDLWHVQGLVGTIWKKETGRNNVLETEESDGFLKPLNLLYSDLT